MPIPKKCVQTDRAWVRIFVGSRTASRSRKKASAAFSLSPATPPIRPSATVRPLAVQRSTTLIHRRRSSARAPAVHCTNEGKGLPPCTVQTKGREVVGAVQTAGSSAAPLRSASSARVTGCWVGIVWSTENTLMNTEAPVDHLESLRFLSQITREFRVVLTRPRIEF